MVGTDALQIALRDKEEALVQSALARIRRAQEKGKREVKLNQDELDALENRRKRMQAAATLKARKGSGESGGSDREKRRRTISVPIAAIEPATTSRPSSRRREKGKSKRTEDVPPHPPAVSNPPGMLVAGPDGLAYAPLGSYPSQPPNRNSPSRPRSATTQQSRGPLPYFQHQQGSNRHFSESMRPSSSASNSSRRPLPDEDSWLPPSSRRSSASSQGFAVDPCEYQVSGETPPPIPHQYLQQASSGRRNVSTPADVKYSSVRRSLPLASGYAGGRAPHSDPNLRRGLVGGFDETSSEEEDSSDELGNGVQVFVEPEVEKAVVPAKKAVGSGSVRRKGKGR